MTVVYIIVIVVVICVLVNVARTSEADSAWKTAAAQLGLANHGGGVLQRRFMQGSYRGFYVKLDTYAARSGNSGAHMRFRLTFSQSLNLGLRITREGFISSVSKEFGAQDIEVGNPSFDAEALVKGADPDAVRAFLTPERQLRIQRFLRGSPNVTIDDRGIQIVEPGLVSDSRRVVAVVRAMAALATALLGESGQNGGPTDAAELANASPQTSRQGPFAPPSIAPPRRKPPPIPVINTSMPSAEGRRVQADLRNLADRQDEDYAAFAESRRAAPEDEEESPRAQQNSRKPRPLSQTPRRCNRRNPNPRSKLPCLRRAVRSMRPRFAKSCLKPIKPALPQRNNSRTNTRIEVFAGPCAA